jgi:hypothetical protein
LALDKMWIGLCFKFVIFSQKHQGPMLWFFNYFLPKNLAKKLAFLTQNKAKFWKKLSKHWYLRKRQFFSRKLGKIAENCDRNIDPGHPVNGVNFHFNV